MEKIVEMDFTLAGSLEKGKRFLYDVEQDAKEIDGWIKAGYAHYVEDEDAIETIAGLPMPEASAAEPVAADPNSAPVANAKRAKAA